MEILKTLDERTLLEMYIRADSEKKKQEIVKLLGDYPF